MQKPSFALLRPIHDLALRLPAYEAYDLAQQMRRACKSIVANIAEGHSRRVSTKEFCRYLTVALGSASEMQVHLNVGYELGYITRRSTGDT